MKLTTERAALAAAVKRASAFVPSRTTLPVLSCLHIAASDTGLRITGTDLNNWVTVECAAAVASPGAVCVVAAQLSAWLSAVPKGALVEMAMGKERITMTAGSAKASFATMDARDYPAPEKLADGAEVLNATAALAMCAPYTSDDETRYYLKGVAINRGHAVATNGHVLCAVDIGADAGVSAIVPNEAVRQIIGAPDGRLFVGAYSWRYEDHGAVMGGKLIEGDFPDWQRILPTAPALIGDVDADAMVEAVNMVQMASDMKTRGLSLKGDGSAIALACKGEAMDATATVTYDGEAFDMGLNAAYAQKAFGSFGGRVVTVKGDGNLVVLGCRDIPTARVLVMGMRV